MSFNNVEFNKVESIDELVDVEGVHEEPEVVAKYSPFSE